MICPKEFFNALTMKGVDFFAGVPDSLLSNFCSYLEDNVGSSQHIIAANEGNAIALGIGHHLATGKIPAIYMQNSGLGNAINPLVSLADSEACKIPMLLIIGWRGEPGYLDEPQHIKQGRITLALLDAMEIPYEILDGRSNIESILNEIFFRIKTCGIPVALVVRKDTFKKYELKKCIPETLIFQREAGLEKILELCCDDDLIVATTGKASRELFELRDKSGNPQRDFLAVGGMGHASSIALGLAVSFPDRRIICLDGDGALLMHMGAMPIIAASKPSKFVHVLLNNSSHESVGGQPTVANQINFLRLANAIGYSEYAIANNVSELTEAWERLKDSKGAVLIELKISKGSRSNLGRPTISPEQNKLAFMRVTVSDG